MADESLKILLLQARGVDDPIKDEERRSFAQKAGLSPDAFVSHDLLDRPPTLAEIRQHQALMVGGSGDYYVSNGDLPRFDQLMDVLRDVVEVGHPTFASCFGFQLMVQALGGQVVHDPATIEVGTYEITLTDDGQRDELLGVLPHRFAAQMGRKDRAARLPPGTRHLASSARCPYQAMRIPNKPIWATQFHPEMNRSENRARFLRYMDGYAPHMEGQVDQESILARFAESPDTERLIGRFLQIVFQ